jgi:hypothetical protein
MVKVRTDMTGWKMCEHGFPESRLTVIRQAEKKYFKDFAPLRNGEDI